MKEIHGLNWLADGVAVILTATQTNETFQIISLISTIIVSLFSAVFTAIRMYYWFKKAKEDGQISKEEVDEAKEIINDFKKDSHK